MHCESICISVDDDHIDGTFAVPRTGVPGILFLHGWTGSQQSDLKRAREIATLGCVCLTFDLRGHAATEAMRMQVTPRQNLHDAVAAYDALASHPMVDKSAMAIVGSSYGAYLATILTSFRPVRWLSLRVPALYRDEHWVLAKGQLDRMDLTTYRNSEISPEENRALAACARFQGDVLAVARVAGIAAASSAVLAAVLAATSVTASAAVLAATSVTVIINPPRMA